MTTGKAQMSGCGEHGAIWALAQKPDPERILWEDLCYMAQQAAEKALKADYRHGRLQYRYVHDLEELGKGLEDSGIVIP